MTDACHHNTRRAWRISSSLHVVWLLAAATSAAQTCPDSGIPGTERPHSSASIDYTTVPVEFSFDGGSSILNGASDLVGAQARQGDRSITADSLHYDFDTKKIKADGNVSYEDTQIRVSGHDANMDMTSGVDFDQASFALKTRAGRGSAKTIQLTQEGNLHLDDVSYTTCPPGKPDWELKVSDLDINQQSRTGTGRNVRLNFKDIPVFYMPWISFPIGNERKTGFLFPNFRSSSRGGYSLLVPWYWNIAPNYDATFTPIIDSYRGTELNSEFRYLSELSKGAVAADYLPHDPTQNSSRHYLQLNHVTDINTQLRITLKGTDASDKHWFEDFGQNRDETSQIFLQRSFVDISGYTQNWSATLLVQNLQRLDDNPCSEISQADYCPDPTTLTPNIAFSLLRSPYLRPYTVMPRLSVIGKEKNLPFGLNFDLAGEATYFSRSDVVGVAISGANKNDPPTWTVGPAANVNGTRVHVAPNISLPLSTPGMYVLPSWRWNYTAYWLTPNSLYLDEFNSVPSRSFDRKPVLSAPTTSIDMAMTFEKTSRDDQRLYTLQPRLLYFNTPYRNQADIPVFDTGLPDFNLVELFRTERFVGPDRLGDSDQLSAGITARMINARSGRQILLGTLGQAFYFKSPCVTSLTSDSCDPNAAHSSPLIAQIILSAFKNWNARIGMQWDPIRSRSERSEINFQYRPDSNRVVNLSYRYSRATNSVANAGATGNTASDRIDQLESSFAWPVSINWSAYGRAVYSRLDNALHDYLGGIEYRSCCWNLRLVVGRSIATREGSYDNRVSLQFEFKGLGSAGTADTFLQSAIPGFSARQPRTN